MTSEQLSATDSVIYRDDRTVLDTLRAGVRGAGISVVARRAKVSRSAVKAFVNRASTPQRSTVAHIDAAVVALGV